MESTEEPREDGGGGGGGEILRPSFPTGRVKKIMKLDRQIKKVNSEALLLISLSAELFLGSLASRSRDAALQRKRRAVKPDHLWSAVCGHQPTSDFLLDCLSKPSGPAAPQPKPKSLPIDKPLPPGARRIDDFFSKPSSAEPPQ